MRIAGPNAFSLIEVSRNTAVSSIMLAATFITVFAVLSSCSAISAVNFEGRMRTDRRPISKKSS
jgi:hypothetical protein